MPELYEHALKYEPSTHIVGSGALATLSGAKTGRSPKYAGAGLGRAGPRGQRSCASRALPRRLTPSALLTPRRDKRVVREPASEADIWWGAGSPNYEMDER